jgi:DNA-binding NarL/FixJ family response regulator
MPLCTLRPWAARIATASQHLANDMRILIAAGKGDAAIAHELLISLETVRNHVSNIFSKLQVPDRAAAIVKAREAGTAQRAR